MVQGLVDPGPDPLLQRVVEDAQQIAGAPIAFVSVVVDYTRFFRAMAGIPHGLANARTIAACDAFCQLVAREGRPWFAEDATQGSELPHDVMDAVGVRAYLAHPVHVHDRPAGALCVVDGTARSWSQPAWEGMVDLAERAGSDLAGSLQDRPDSRAERVRDELHALLRLTRALNDGPLTMDDVRVALSVLDQPVQLLESLRDDPALRRELERTFEMDLGSLFER